MRLDEGVNSSKHVEFDRLELELRKLAQVVAVGFEGASSESPVSEDSIVSVHLLVSDIDAGAAIEQQALDLGRLHLGRPLRVIISADDEESTSALIGAGHLAPKAPTRVQLVSVTLADGGDSVEVTLAHGDQHATARAGIGSLGKVVGATVAALRKLGWAVPFDLESSVRVAVGSTAAVLVHLHGPDGDRLGVASGDTAEQGAAKATLQALNRWLDDPSRRPMSAQPASTS